MCCVVIKHFKHLRTPEKCRKYSYLSPAFYTSLVFSSQMLILFNDHEIYGFAFFVCEIYYPCSGLLKQLNLFLLKEKRS